MGDWRQQSHVTPLCCAELGLLGALDEGEDGEAAVDEEAAGDEDAEKAAFCSLITAWSGSITRRS